jgi:molybdenum cofactor biosynthesis protein B
MSQSQAVSEHRAAAPDSLNLAVLTVSDTRTMETDTSGALIVAVAEEAGHRILERVISPDDPVRMTRLIGGFAARGELHAVLVTGGTGISPRDQTYETVTALLTKPLPGYGELFRMLSYAEIGSACLLSRAVGGLIGQLVVLVMPGSRAAVELAMRKIIVPELPHIVREARKTPGTQRA